MGGKQELHNYCEDAAQKIPADVQRLIGKVSEIHRKIATLLGEIPSALFQTKVNLVIRANPLGSSQSGGNRSVVLIGTDSKWKVDTFPSALYAHELMHFLTENPGPYQYRLRGLRDHPFVLEAFPDLISTTVMGSPKIMLSELYFPRCLRELRNESPVHSLNAPYSWYSYLASSEKAVACCQSLSLAKEPNPVRIYCESIQAEKVKKQSEKSDFLKNDGVRALVLTSANRTKPFEATDCLAETRTGLVYLNHCDVHQFGYPLVSFFFRLKERIGKSLVPAFFTGLRKSENEVKSFECNYVARFYQSAVPALLELRSLAGAFHFVRASLKPTERLIYDDVWKEHGMDRLIEIDRLFISEALPGLAQVAVNEKNASYSQNQGCDDVLHMDLKFCRTSCRSLRAK